MSYNYTQQLRFSKRCIKRKCTRNINEFNSKHLNGIVCSFDRKFAFEEVCYKLRSRYIIQQDIFHKAIIDSEIDIFVHIKQHLFSSILIFIRKSMSIEKGIEYEAINIWQIKNLQTPLKVKKRFFKR